MLIGPHILVRLQCWTRGFTNIMQGQPNIIIPQLINAFRQGNFSNVVDAIEASPALVNVDPVVVQLYGGSLRKLAEHKKAAKVFEKGLKKFPSSTDLMNSYGNFLLESGNAVKASQLFRKASSINAESFDYKYNLTRSLYAEKKYREALQLGKQLVEARSNHVSLLILLAAIQVELGNIEIAEAHLVSALNIDNRNVTALNNMGNLKRGQGKLVEAIRNYELALTHAVQANADTPLIYQNLAAVMGLNGDTESSLAVYQRGLSRFPTNSELNKEYAHFAWIKNISSPFAFFEEQLSDENAELVLVYCELMLRIGEPSKARYWLEKLIGHTDKSTSIAATAHLSSALRDLGEFEAALTLSESKLKAAQGNTVALLVEKGYALLSLRKYKDAIVVFEKVCRMAPLNQGYWTLLSTAYKANGNSNKYKNLCDYQCFVHATKLLTDSAANISFVQELKDHLSTLHNDERHPIGQSLRNGSQTFENLLDSKHQLLQTLRRVLEERAQEFIGSLKTEKKHPFLSRLSDNLNFIGSWSVRLRRSGFHKSHYHSEGWLSGVLYVDVPEEVNQGGNGWLCFGRPDINGVAMDEDYAIKPEAGTVVFFPSYLWHGTNPIETESQRMTVAFDIVPN